MSSGRLDYCFLSFSLVSDVLKFSVLGMIDFPCSCFPLMKFILFSVCLWLRLFSPPLFRVSPTLNVVSSADVMIVSCLSLCLSQNVVMSFSVLKTDLLQDLFITIQTIYHYSSYMVISLGVLNAYFCFPRF